MKMKPESNVPELSSSARRHDDGHHRDGLHDDGSHDDGLHDDGNHADGLHDDGDKREFTPLSHQVAGHRTVDGKPEFAMLHGRWGRVLKPLQDHDRGKTELNFYKHVFRTETETMLSLRPFLAHFYGLLSQNGSKISYLELSDLTYSYQEPSITDIKMGTLLYGPEKIAEDPERIDKKYPLAKHIGYQILGMKVFCPSSNSYLSYDKTYFRRSLTLDNVVDNGINLFLQCAVSSVKVKIVSGILTRLKRIRAWFESQRQFVFYGSSLLIMFEGRASQSCQHGDSQGKKSEKLVDDSCANVDVRMIDFTHVFASEIVDENYLHGLNSLISHFDSLLTVEQS